MTTRLLCLHGFSQNGDALRSHLSDVLPDLPDSLELDFSDAPHECSAASVERLYRFMGGMRLPPPHRCYWDSTDDGRIYRGAESTCQALRERASGAARIGIFGFSQGAAVGAALCGLSARGEFPEIAFAVLVAGRKPRADDMQAWFTAPLEIPSLHIWGERDAFATRESPALVECFSAEGRKVARWDGPHVVPTRGPGRDAIVSFLREHAG